MNKKNLKSKSHWQVGNTVKDWLHTLTDEGIGIESKHFVAYTSFSSDTVQFFNSKGFFLCYISFVKLDPKGRGQIIRLVEKGLPGSGGGGGGERKGVQFPICSSSALIWIRVSTTVSLRKAKEICKDYMDNNNDDDNDDDDRKHFNITRNQGTSTCQMIQSCKNTLGCVILFGW